MIAASDDQDRMVTLRREGRTLQEIALQFGITRERVRQITNQALPAEEWRALRARRSEQARAERLAADIATLDREDVLARFDAGETLKAIGGQPRSRRYQAARTLIEQERGTDLTARYHGQRYQSKTDRREHIAAMWREGLPMRQIAEAVGCSPGTLSVEVTRMRTEGWDLPLRSTHKGQSRYVIAETDDVRAALDAARQAWPDARTPGELLHRLIGAGRAALTVE